MKRFLLMIICATTTAIVVAQNTRVVQGVVMDTKDNPIAKAVVSAVSSSERTTTADNGSFTINVSPYVKELKVSAPGYFPMELEVDGSYLMFRLKVDKAYLNLQAQAAEQARLEAQRKAEAERIAKEKAEAAKAKAAEQAKLEAQRKANEERIAKEKAAAAKAKAAEQARLEAQRKAEAERIAKEKAEAAKAKAAEQARLEAQRKAEEERIAKEKAEAAKAKAAEQVKKAQMAKIAAEKRKKDYAKTQKGFGSLIDVSYMMGINYPHPSFGISYTAGYRFNNQIFLGAGVGANLNFDGGSAVRSVESFNDPKNNFLNPGLISVPAFLYFRANFINRRCSPFFALAAGGHFSTKQTLKLDMCDVDYNVIGAFANPQLGINFRTTTRTSIYLAAGFQCFTTPSCVEYTGYNAVFRPALGYGVDFHFGFTF